MINYTSITNRAIADLAGDEREVVEVFLPRIYQDMCSQMDTQIAENTVPVELKSSPLIDEEQ